MQPHEQRVVDEKTDLEEKITSLGSFLGSEIFISLSNEEKSDLVRQIGIMQEYCDILTRRINRFYPDY